MGEPLTTLGAMMAGVPAKPTITSKHAGGREGVRARTLFGNVGRSGGSSQLAIQR